jgi:hypothetical protein
MGIRTANGTQSTPVAANRNFPEVAKLDTVPHTAFVQTLEHNLPGDKNIVYTPAFLYAWDEIRKNGAGTITPFRQMRMSD